MHDAYESHGAYESDVSRNVDSGFGSDSRDDPHGACGGPDVSGARREYELRGAQAPYGTRPAYGT
ncbi:hypothetical protein GCM10009535_04780 [Streptomyces thermocarboxydovorans]|uniref:Uncharacterized protein n=1 Tax=Streptomyces thermocarboxydovorans TaxID=59298 RepID=A0ABP3SBY8_9ACTN